MPDDVAEAALFLASDRSSWISGITIDVAGGSVLV
jgi:3-oxoacyl-[acyl-carrier protein] reductase